MTCNQSVQRLFSAKYIYSQTIHKNLISKVCYSSHLQRSFGSAGNSGYFDVLVVGGGIMGSSTAHWLTKRDPGLRVGVVEPDPSYSTSATTLSVGGLRQQFSLSENIQIGLYARDFMRNYPESIFEGSTVPADKVPDVKFQPHGYLFLASEAGYDILKQNHDTQTGKVANGAGHIELLNSKQLRQKFPWLITDGVVAGCYGGNHEGWFDPWALLQAFKMSAINRGAEYVTGRAEKCENRDGLPSKITIRLADQSLREIEFDKLVVAAGGDSGQVGHMLGLGQGEGDLSVAIPVEKRKRYVYVPHCPGGPGMDCPLVIDPTGVYFRREGLGGNYLCGQSPTQDQEPDNTDLDNVDMDWFDEQVWPVLAARVKAFEELKVKSAWAGNYDYCHWDENGIIGKHPVLQNVYMACGFSGHGIQQGPAVGRAITELIIDGHYSSIDLTNLGFKRLLEKTKMLERYCV